MALYSAVLTRSAAQILKKLDPYIRAFIIKQIDKIAAEPYRAQKLTGRYNFFRSFHFGFKGVQYRIIFEIKEESKEIVVHLLGKRANIYQLLKRYFR